MEAINYTVVRQTLAQKMDQVCDDHTPIIITRQNNQIGRASCRERV